MPRPTAAIRPSQIPTLPPPIRSDIEPERKGRTLRAELTAVSPGKSGWSQFEKTCRACLEYALADDLTDWRPQEQTATGLHRFDVVARIRSDNDFWTALARDFRTRYVVFEFKNYSEKLNQGQIHTTEKYLYPVALRGTAIIISRHGPDRHAEASAPGALRETVS